MAANNLTTAETVQGAVVSCKVSNAEGIPFAVKYVQYQNPVKSNGAQVSRNSVTLVADGQNHDWTMGRYEWDGREFIITLLLKLNLILKACDRKNHLFSLAWNIIKKDILPTSNDNPWITICILIPPHVDLWDIVLGSNHVWQDRKRWIVHISFAHYSIHFPF